MKKIILGILIFLGSVSLVSAQSVSPLFYSSASDLIEATAVGDEFFFAFDSNGDQFGGWYSESLAQPWRVAEPLDNDPDIWIPYADVGLNFHIIAVGSGYTQCGTYDECLEDPEFIEDFLITYGTPIVGGTVLDWDTASGLITDSLQDYGNVLFWIFASLMGIMVGCLIFRIGYLHIRNLPGDPGYDPSRGSFRRGRGRNVKIKSGNIL